MSGPGGGHPALLSPPFAGSPHSRACFLARGSSSSLAFSFMLDLPFLALGSLCRFWVLSMVLRLGLALRPV